jgi:hypothetical protein
MVDRRRDGQLDERKSHGVPEALRDILIDEPWELSKLWALDLPVFEVSVDDLRWQLELPWWRLGDGWFALTPSEVLARPDGAHASHWRRARRADTTAPIHVRRSGTRLVIIDGVHRLLRAVFEGKTSLPARCVPPAMLPLIYRATP